MKAALSLFLLVLAGLAQAQQVVPVPMPNPPRIRVTPEPANSADVLADNYQVTLTITDKDAAPTELSIVTNSRSFIVNSGDPLTFQGGLSVNEDGTFLVGYALGWEFSQNTGNGNVQFRNSSAQGSVRLKDDEELTIYKGGTRTIKLKIKKLASTKP